MADTFKTDPFKTGAVDWLLAGKLQPPRLGVSLIDRPRLLAQLENGLQKRLTLIHAPAGFGKTSLLAQWHEYLGVKGIPAAWLSFDADDTDPFQVLSYLAQSLSMIAPSLGRMVGQVSGRATFKAVSNMLARILHELQGLPDSVLLLDDYHLVHSREVHDLIMQLIKAAPGNLRLVVTTRSRSLLPVSSLLVQGQVMEIEPADLRLSDAEIGQVFGSTLDARSLDVLQQRTEGWPMAVQLAHHWTEGSGASAERISMFSGNRGDVATYLTEQIIRDLSDDVRQFLVQISIADEINGDLANAICGRDDAWELLSSLEHLVALVVPIDPENGWFRFHHLFADYLRGRLKMLGEEKVRTLHMKASQWFSAHHHLNRAVRHAVLAGEYTVAAELIESAGAVWLSVQLGARRLQRLLDYLPLTMIDVRPRLRAARALLWMKEGLLVEAQREVEEINRLRGTPLWSDEAAKDVLLVGSAVTGQGDDGVVMEVVLALESLIGDAALSNRWLQGVLNELLSLSHTRRGNVILAVPPAREALHIYDEAGAASGQVFSRLHLCIALLAQGRLQQSVDYLSYAVKLGRDRIPNDTATIAMVEVMLAYALYEQNELVAAEALFIQALEEAESAEGWLEIFHAGYMTASGISLARGDVDGALRQVEHGIKTAKRRGLTRLQNILDHRRLEILTLTKPQSVQLLDVAQALLTLEKNADDLTLLEREAVTITLCRLAIHQGVPQLAVRHLQGMQKQAEKLGRGRTVIKLLVLQAFAAQAMGTMDDAATAIRKALAMAAAEGWRRLFLEEGPGITALLDETLKHMQISSLNAEAVTFLAEIFSAQIDPQGVHRDDPSEILKPREREVLIGLKHGFSNKVIARELDLTDNAIKYHLKKIYAKLGVSDRSMAVTVAERHGIL